MSDKPRQWELGSFPHEKSVGRILSGPKIDRVTHVIEKSAADKLAKAIENFYLAGGLDSNQYYQEMVKALKQYRGESE